MLSELSENPFVEWTRSPATLAAADLAWDAAIKAGTEGPGRDAAKVDDGDTTVYVMCEAHNEPVMIRGPLNEESQFDREDETTECCRDPRCLEQASEWHRVLQEENTADDAENRDKGAPSHGAEGPLLRTDAENRDKGAPSHGAEGPL
jgi:hypothetical protein